MSLRHGKERLFDHERGTDNLVSLHQLPSPKLTIARHADSDSFDHLDRRNSEAQPLATGLDDPWASRHEGGMSRLRDERSPIRDRLISANQHWAGHPLMAPVWVLLNVVLAVAQFLLRQAAFLKPGHLGRTRSGKLVGLLKLLLRWSVAGAVLYSVMTFLFFPSYTRVPRHYRELRRAAYSSHETGRINPQGQRIMIAAALHDPKGELLSGAWGKSVLQLVDLLGPEHTLLSIYLSDSGVEGTQALAAFADKVTCSKILKAEEHVDVDHMARIRLEDGTTVVKRIEYLAAARNIALKPIYDNGPFTKLLFLNDVYFDPVEAAQLLFSTNYFDGQSNYRAACAVDFDNPFKFYDTLATRDLKGYSMGVPIYPWFSAHDEGWSRSDVLKQKDAVRVRSCWGGMVAFDAQFFQQPVHSKQEPLKFRAVQELDWEYSECCLIHADLSAAEPPLQNPTLDSGVFMNPYIRTAYSPSTFNFLWLGRRLERVLRFFQHPLNILARLPKPNERREMKPGKTMQRIMWDGHGTITKNAPHWVKRETPTKPGMFCGIHHLLYHRLNAKEGEPQWETIWVPDGVEAGRSIPGVDMQYVDTY